VAGDKLLAAFGALLIAHGRRSDIAFRFGGEEFCLLMPRTDAFAAQRKVEALLGAWRDEVFQFETGTLHGNTFSAGIADSLAELAAMEQLLKIADDRLLEAKRSGRNQVLAADLRADPVEA
jgi:diguanylate cyclase (GGDEF)-like protein